MKRVDVVVGDLSQPLFGMVGGAQTFEDLGRSIDCVVHCGSHVNLVHSYRALYRSNVLSTQEALRLACFKRGTEFVYISSLGVFPKGGAQTELSSVGPFLKIPDGYGRTKAVSEGLVREAGRRGVPVTIFRLGNMAADTWTGRWNQMDFHFLLFSACMAAGPSFPLVHSWNMELTPVDFASHSIVALAQARSSRNKSVISSSAAQNLDTYHLVNPHRMAFERFAEDLLPGPRQPEYVEWNVWRDRLSQIKNDRVQLLSFLLNEVDSPAELASNVFTNHCAATERCLRSLRKPLCMEINNEIIEIWRPQLMPAGVVLSDVGSDGAAAGSLALTSSASPHLGAVASPPLPPPLQSLPLHGRVAVVSGASRGIGAGIASALAAAGARVAIGARSLDALQSVARDIRSKIGSDRRSDVIARVCDVTFRSHWKHLVAEAERLLGPVDILVNCAGVMPYTYMKNLEEDQWSTMLQVNCQGVLNGVGAVLNKMVERKRGHIINISSDAGRKVFSGLTVYSATKHFVEAMSRGLRQEVAEFNVRVTTIQPGDVKTEIASTTTDKEAAACGDYLKDPNVRILSTEDIGNAVLFALQQPPNVAVNEILVEPTQFPI